MTLYASKMSKCHFPNIKVHFCVKILLKREVKVKVKKKVTTLKYIQVLKNKK